MESSDECCVISNLPSERSKGNLFIALHDEFVEKTASLPTFSFLPQCQESLLLKSPPPLYRDVSLKKKRRRVLTVQVAYRTAA